MQNITLTKIQDESYRPNALKAYKIIRDGTVVGSIGQNFGQRWEIVNPEFERVSVHPTIKAAVRVDGRVV